MFTSVAEKLYLITWLVELEENTLDRKQDRDVRREGQPCIKGQSPHEVGFELPREQSGKTTIWFLVGRFVMGFKYPKKKRIRKTLMSKTLQWRGKWTPIPSACSGGRWRSWKRE